MDTSAKADPLPPDQATEPLVFGIVSSKGRKSTIKIPAIKMSKIDELALSLLLSYKSESDDNCGIFQGFGTAVDVKNEPTAMLTLINTLAAALTPVVKKEGEESDEYSEK